MSGDPAPGFCQRADTDAGAGGRMNGIQRVTAALLPIALSAVVIIFAAYRIEVVWHGVAHGAQSEPGPVFFTGRIFKSNEAIEDERGVVRVKAPNLFEVGSIARERGVIVKMIEPVANLSCREDQFPGTTEAHTVIRRCWDTIVESYKRGANFLNDGRRMAIVGNPEFDARQLIKRRRTGTSLLQSLSDRVGENISVDRSEENIGAFGSFRQFDGLAQIRGLNSEDHQLKNEYGRLHRAHYDQPSIEPGDIPIRLTGGLLIRRVLIAIALLLGGFFWSLRGWNDLYEKRRLICAAQILCGLLLDVLGLSLILITGFAWSWRWWL